MLSLVMAIASEIDLKCASLRSKDADLNTRSGIDRGRPAKRGLQDIDLLRVLVSNSMYLAGWVAASGPVPDTLTARMNLDSAESNSTL